ncbi:MAG TPA: tetratricopeptide repeat protein [Spirochaetota bacterium]|nr:tetratricopeptide repeat protein [Spirochaetota bacterium]
MAKINVEDLNKGQDKFRNLTIGIIAAVLVVFAVSLTLYIINYSLESSAAKVFEKAYIKILDFDKQTNIYSKQEFEKEIIPILDEVIAKYKSTSAGKRAYFYKGYILYNTEKYENAEKIFKYFVESMGSSHLTEKAYYFLSYCYENLNKQDEAINILKIFDGKLKNSYYSSLAYYRLGELYQKKGEKDNAIIYYRKIVDNKDATSQKENAKKQLLLLKNDIKL